MQKITRRVSKILLLFSLSAFMAPETYSHKYWGDDFDDVCGDGHSTKDVKYRHVWKHPKWKCYDIPVGAYKVIDKQGHGNWEECPKGKYCPGGSAGKIKPDRYSIAPDEGMSKPKACSKNKLSDNKRLTCSYPKNLSEWGDFLETKPKKSKYKDGRLVCKKGTNYSQQKGICR